MAKEINNGSPEPKAEAGAVAKGGADTRGFAFDRVNFILMAVSFVIVLVGFVLMSGAGSTEETFNPDIFSARRIKVAPIVCFVGFVSMIYAVLRKPRSK